MSYHWFGLAGLKYPSYKRNVFEAAGLIRLCFQCEFDKFYYQTHGKLCFFNSTLRPQCFSITQATKRYACNGFGIFINIPLVLNEKHTNPLYKRNVCGADGRNRLRF